MYYISKKIFDLCSFLNKYKFYNYYLLDIKSNSVINYTLKYHIPFLYIDKRKYKIIEHNNYNLKFLDSTITYIEIPRPIIQIKINNIKLNKLKNNLFSVDKNLPIYFLVRLFENINLDDEVEITIKYIESTKKIKINKYSLLKNII